MEHQRIYNELQALDAAEALGYPVVLKPFTGTRGFGVICDIKTPEELRWAIGASEASIETCLIEKFYVGDYARVTMMENEFIEIRHIELPRVRCDGQSTLGELIHTYLNSPEDTYLDGKLRTQKFMVDFDHAVKKFICSVWFVGRAMSSTMCPKRARLFVSGTGYRHGMGVADLLAEARGDLRRST